MNLVMCIIVLVSYIYLHFNNISRCGCIFKNITELKETASGRKFKCI